MPTAEIRLGVLFILALILTFFFLPDQEEPVPPAWQGGIIVNTQN